MVKKLFTESQLNDLRDREILRDANLKPVQKRARFIHSKIQSGASFDEAVNQYEMEAKNVR